MTWFWVDTCLQHECESEVWARLDVAGGEGLEWGWVQSQGNEQGKGGGLRVLG